MTPTQAIFLGLVAILILLIVCPSRAGMWRWCKFFCEDHELANMLIDERKAERARANKLEEQS